MIRAVVNNYKWSPALIDEMYCDGIDHKGLEFWYDEVDRIHKELNKKK